MRLAQTYPGVISNTKSYAENLKALTKAAEGSKTEMNLLNSQMIALKSREIHLKVVISKQQVEKKAEEITDIFAEKGNKGETFLEGLFGGDANSARLRGENMIEPYLKAMKKATSTEEINKITTQMRLDIANGMSTLTMDGAKVLDVSKLGKQAKDFTRDFDKKFGFGSLDDTQKSQMINKAAELGTAQINAFNKSRTASKTKVLSMYQVFVDGGSDKETAINEADAKLDKVYAEQQNKENERAKKTGEKAKDISKDRIRQIVDNAEKEAIADADAKKAIDTAGDVKLDTPAAADKNPLKTTIEGLNETLALKKKNLDLQMQEYEMLVQSNELQKGALPSGQKDLLLGVKKLELAKKEIIDANADIKAALEKEKITYTIDGSVLKFPDEATMSKEMKASATDIMKIWNDQQQNAMSLDLDVKAKIKDVNLSDEEMEKLRTDLEERKIDYNLSIGIDEETSKQQILDGYKATLAVLEADSTLANNEFLSFKMTPAPAEGIDLAFYNSNYKKLEKITIDAENKKLDYKEKISAAEKDLLEKELQASREYWDAYLEDLDRKAEKELEAINRYSDAYNSSLAKVQEQYQNKLLKAIDSEQAAKMKTLDKWRDNESVSAEEYELRKTEIEEKARQERDKKAEQYNRLQMLNEKFRQGQTEVIDKQVLESKRDALTAEMSILKAKKKANEDAGKNPFDSIQDKETYDKIASALGAAEKAIVEKGSTIDIVLSDLQGGVTDAIGNLFTGDPEGAVDSIKAMFGEIFGVLTQALKKQVTAFILQTVLSTFTTDGMYASLPLIVKLGLLPVVTTLATGAINVIANPILKGLSMATGGAIDQPVTTQLTVGDGAILGGVNREWFLRDDQLKTALNMAATGGAGAVAEQLNTIMSALSNQKLIAEIHGEKLLMIIDRTQARQNNRKK